jgi:hypothetical protein
MRTGGLGPCTPDRQCWPEHAERRLLVTLPPMTFQEETRKQPPPPNCHAASIRRSAGEAIRAGGLRAKAREFGLFNKGLRAEVEERLGKCMKAKHAEEGTQYTSLPTVSCQAWRPSTASASIICVYYYCVLFVLYCR